MTERGPRPDLGHTRPIIDKAIDTAQKAHKGYTTVKEGIKEAGIRAGLAAVFVLSDQLTRNNDPKVAKQIARFERVLELGSNAYDRAEALKGKATEIKERVATARDGVLNTIALFFPSEGKKREEEE